MQDVIYDLGDLFIYTYTFIPTSRPNSSGIKTLVKTNAHMHNTNYGMTLAVIEPSAILKLVCELLVLNVCYE